MKPTLNQKRFLIVWILFNLFALFVNLAGLNLKVYEDGSNTEDRHYVYLGTTGDSDGFWPFTSYYKKSLGMSSNTVKYPDGNALTFQGVPDAYYYGGLFNSYGIVQFIVYVCLSLILVFVPKLWRRDSTSGI